MTALVAASETASAIWRWQSCEAPCSAANATAWRRRSPTASATAGTVRVAPEDVQPVTCPGLPWARYRYALIAAARRAGNIEGGSRQRGRQRLGRDVAA